MKLLWWKILAALGFGVIRYPYAMTAEDGDRALFPLRVTFPAPIDDNQWRSFREKMTATYGPFVVRWSMELQPEFQRTSRPKRYEYRARYRVFKPVLSAGLIVYLSLVGLLVCAVSIERGWNKYACLVALFVFVFGLAMDQLNDDVAGTLEQGDM